MFKTLATTMKNGVVKVTDRDTGEHVNVLWRKDGTLAVYAHQTSAKVEVKR